MSDTGRHLDVVVLGSGSKPNCNKTETVIGLAIASHLVKRGLRVAVVARDLAEDITSQGFASPWAGASWQSWAANEQQRRWDGETYKFYIELMRTHPDLAMRTPTQFLWNEGGDWDRWFMDLVKDFRPMRADELPMDRKFGYSWTGVTVNPPRLMKHLSDNLRDAGVPIIRYRATSLDELYSLFGTVRLVVNASGLGSRCLLGVQDETMHPRRGQTIVVRSPSCKTLITDDTPHPDPEESTYIIPRPGPENHVVIGGVYQPHRWDQWPEWKTAEHILRKAFAWCPELAEGGNSWKDIEIVAHNVGFRTGRDEGMRLSLERRRIGDGTRRELMPKEGRKGFGRNVAVIHAYGTPTGYMSHWGIGAEAADMAVKYLEGSGSFASRL